jgi:hypothetical protein
MSSEPLPCQFDDLVERTRFFGQVGGAGHDLEALLALQLDERLLVQLQQAGNPVRPRLVSSVGARTRPSTGPAMSGRPPRETMAAMSSCALAAATSAAAAPVLAPK